MSSLIIIKYMKKREAENISREVIDILKKERQSRNISRYKIAKDTGLSESSLSYIERKSQQPSLTTLLIIASYLKINLGKIISEFDEN